MQHGLPIELQDFLERRLEGVSRAGLRERAARMSASYRADGNSETLRDGLDALAYAAVRMPGTFAAARAAAGRVAEALPGFAPASLLDAGAGPGATTRACRAVWPSIASATLLDRNEHLLAFAAASFAAEPDAGVLTQRRELPGGLEDAHRADLVVAGYVLNELTAEAQARTLDRLWGLTSGVLLLVEPGTSDGFARLLGFRARLLGLGAHLVAPCSHAGPCPLAGPGQERWCHFARRLPRSRDHRLIKGVEAAFEDEKYGYLAFSRRASAAAGSRILGPRILATPRVTKGEARLTVCAPGEPAEVVVRRSDKAGYKAAKKLTWGDTAPPGSTPGSLPGSTSENASGGASEDASGGAPDPGGRSA